MSDSGVAELVGFMTFVIVWLYAIATYGFLFGVGLGWLPAIVIATIAGLCWPYVLFLAVSWILLMILL